MTLAGAVVLGCMLGTGASTAKAQLFIGTRNFAFGLGAPAPVVYPPAAVYPAPIAYPAPLVYPAPIYRPYPAPLVYRGAYYGPRYYGYRGYRRW
jgi:hypothetical protein